MNRRRFLGSVAAVSPIGIAGCLAFGAHDPSFTVSAPTVQQGGRAAVAITAPNVTGMHFSEHPAGFPFEDSREAITIEFSEAQFSPSPDMIWTASPPNWSWSPAQSIAGQVPVQVSADVPPGDYPFEVSISSREFEERQSKRSTITVNENTGDR